MMNPEDGTILDFKTLYTWADVDSDDRPGRYLPTIPDDAIVLVGIADEATRHLSDADRQVIADTFGSTLIDQIGFRCLRRLLSASPGDRRFGVARKSKRAPSIH